MYLPSLQVREKWFRALPNLNRVGQNLRPLENDHEEI